MLHSFGSRGLPLAIHHLDYWAKKGALVVTVRPDGGSPIRLVNTHLIARYTSHGQEHGDEYLGLSLRARALYLLRICLFNTVWLQAIGRHK